MFKDKYKKDNEFIKPDSEKLIEIENKIRFSNLKNNKKYFYKKPLLAIFTSFLIIILGAFLFKYISINQNNDKKNIAFENKNTKLESSVATQKSYDDIYKELDKLISQNNSTLIATEEYSGESINSSQDISSMKEFDSTEDSLSNSNNYTNTNIQVFGVDEGDIVKTDGNYIYSLNKNNLYISKVSNGNINISSKIELSNNENYNPLELYIEENTLTIISQKYDEKDYSSMKYATVDCLYAPNGDTCLEIYDISDKENPKLINSLNQNGFYSSSRMVGNKLYVISNYYINTEDIDKDKPETFVPSINNGTREKCLDANYIYIFPNINQSNYVLITSLDIKSPYEFESEKAVLGNSNNIYMSLENLYITSYDYEEKDGYGYDKTNIIKIKLNDGTLEFKASESINGSLSNQFFMDEKDDYLRVVTTLNKSKITTENEVSSAEFLPTSNNLYILDSNLKTVGAIENIAENETVYSVRFDGDIGYFVTFRQVDPLFSVDLSNPSNPIILGSLKIPGFSEYMHPYDENMLLGLGKEATEEGKLIGLKLSMFDTSDKTNLTEINKLVLEDYKYSYSFDNHKTITIDSNRNLISFPAMNDYLIFEYSKEKGFIQKGKITFNAEDYTTLEDKYIDFYTYEGDIRGVYIDNFLYLCAPNWIKAYSTESFTEVSSCDFN